MPCLVIFVCGGIYPCVVAHHETLFFVFKTPVGAGLVPALWACPRPGLPPETQNLITLLVARFCITISNIQGAVLTEKTRYNIEPFQGACVSLVHRLNPGRCHWAEISYLFRAMRQPAPGMVFEIFSESGGKTVVNKKKYPTSQGGDKPRAGTSP